MRRVRLLRRSLILDQQMVCFSAFLLLRFSNACVTRRSAWSKYRSQAFFSIVVSRWTDREWKKNFRVSRITFHFLCRELAPFLTKRHVVRKPLSVDQRVAMCLWRLGTNVEYRTISHLFGVGLSTVCVAVHEVCNVLVEHFRSKYIKIPSGQGLRSVIDGFESKWDFPQCVGAIDGSHIPIIAPKDNPLDYYNRKGYHSVVLQALVDHNYKFLDVYVGWPGSVHDARVLANSGLYQRGENGLLTPNWSRTLGGINIPLLILGDPAYPLRTWLMKPFSDTGLSAKQRRFNYKLSRARVVVENAFGRLKGEVEITDEKE